MKKILHVINSLDLGGAETALYRLLCAMQNQSYDFCVIVLSRPGYYSELIEDLGIPIYYFDIRQNNRLKTLYQFLRLVRQIKPDIVQTWLYHSDFIGGLCAKLCRVKKIIWSIRCEGVYLKASTKKVKQSCALLSWFIPDLILNNSQAALQHHIHAGYHAKKMRVIYNGFDTHLFAPVKPNKTILELPTNAILIGTLARFHADKDYLNLIQTIDTICSQHQNAYFIFCGQDCDADNIQLNTLLAELVHRDRVILIGKTNHAAAYLQQLDLFILSSKTESFPNCLAEAMACGLACIATDVGEVRNVLGEAGLIICPNDPEQLAAACLTMLAKTKADREKLGAAARKKIEMHYSMTQHVMQMQEIYDL